MAFKYLKTMIVVPNVVFLRRFSFSLRHPMASFFLPLALTATHDLFGTQHSEVCYQINSDSRNGQSSLMWAESANILQASLYCELIGFLLPRQRMKLSSFLFSPSFIQEMPFEPILNFWHFPMWWRSIMDKTVLTFALMEFIV